MILFAVIRAPIAVAIAVGSGQPNTDWMPIATLIAMKPNLQQSTVVAEQRLAGAFLGAALAALFLLTIHSKSALDVIVLFALGLALRGVNYAICPRVTRQNCRSVAVEETRIRPARTPITHDRITAQTFPTCRA